MTAGGWRMACTELLPLTGVIAGVAGVAALAGRHGDQTAPWAALLYSSGIVFVIFVGLDVIAGGWNRPAAGPPTRQRYGWLGLVLGADGRLSTSKSQVFLWTAGIAWSVLYLSGIVIFASGHDASVLDKTQWDNYLVLLGGPFAAGVLAKFTLVSQLDAGTTQKSLTPAASASLGAAAPVAAADATKASNLVTNDSGELDLVDTQYFIFNLVAFAYVFGLFIGRIIDPNVADAATKYSLPAVPSVILALTSASAATYVANKAVQKSGPRISALNPPSPASGQNGEIFGVNLVPAGADPNSVADHTSILVADTAAGGSQYILAPAPATTPSPTKITVAVPAPLKGKQVQIRVVTVNGVATDPYTASVT